MGDGHPSQPPCASRERSVAAESAPNRGNPLVLPMTVRTAALLSAALLPSATTAQGHTSDYRRPPSSRVLSIDDLGTTCGSGCSEQIHIALGGQEEMIVSFATDETVPAVVTWWPEDSPSEVTVANGTRDAYSQLMYYVGELVDSAMGATAMTEAELLQLQNTSYWAKWAPFFAHRHGSSYKPRSEPKMGLGSYKNPAEIYNSPVLCTVTLAPLAAGTTYSYTVAGSDATYSFTMPPTAAAPDSVYPFTLGLTADIGQTEVTRANVQLLRDALEGSAGAVLLAGDLSYADGYYSRWDTYGRMMEGLAARVLPAGSKRRRCCLTTPPAICLSGPSEGAGRPSAHRRAA